jgi:hypothetical protein
MTSQDIMGGYITAKYVSFGTHSFSVVLFTDATIDINRPTIKVDFGDLNIGTLSLTNTSVSGGLNFKTYTGIHSYPQSSNYLVTYRDSFFVTNIKNLPNSQLQKLELRSLISGANSSPILNNNPININQTNSSQFTYNPSFSDLDGDSLSYILFTACQYNDYLPWLTTLDASSGQFSFTNDTTGLFVFSFIILEWRKPINGGSRYFIGETKLIFVINKSGITRLNEFMPEFSELQLFPNPVINELNILHTENLDENTLLEVINSMGQTVIKTNYTNKIDVSSLTNGVYFLKLSSKLIRPSTSKFVKQ